MKTSVVIPTYNSSATIDSTLASVLSQNEKPSEILVLDDGSRDDTMARLERYKDSITILTQPNCGVAQARNVLTQHAAGELIAFLDHDDLWHPDYLGSQRRLYDAHPEGAVFFGGHHNFYGHGSYDWQKAPEKPHGQVEVLEPLKFLSTYYLAPGKFVSMSLCCIPKARLQQIGPDPFCSKVSGVDDFHLYHQLLLLGPIVYDPNPLVAYRLTEGAQSASLLKAVGQAVCALELLEPRFRNHSDARIRGAFQASFAAQRREYAKVLMGVAEHAKARRQLMMSLKQANEPVSFAKSLAILMLTAAPALVQPKWPSQWKKSHSLAR